MWQKVLSKTKINKSLKYSRVSEKKTMRRSNNLRRQIANVVGVQTNKKGSIRNKTVDVNRTKNV